MKKDFNTILFLIFLGVFFTGIAVVHNKELRDELAPFEIINGY